MSKTKLSHWHVCLPYSKMVATTVGWKSNWIIIVNLVKMSMSYIYSYQREWGSWAHTFGLPHLSPVHSPEPSGVLCVLYLWLIIHLLIEPLIACWFLFVFSWVVYILLHNHNLSSNCFSRCPVNYYNYKSVWLYIKVIHMLSHSLL